jgi:hypothetical protein
MVNSDAAVGETKVVATGTALFTVTTSEMERHRHTVAYAEALYFGAHFDDCASELVAGHSGKSQFKSKPGPVVLPQVPITAANSASLGLNNRVGRDWGGIREILNFQRFFVLSNYCASHIVLLVNIARFSDSLVTTGE